MGYLLVVFKCPLAMCIRISMSSWERCIPVLSLGCFAAVSELIDLVRVYSFPMGVLSLGSFAGSVVTL